LVKPVLTYKLITVPKKRDQVPWESNHDSDYRTEHYVTPEECPPTNKRDRKQNNQELTCRDSFRHHCETSRAPCDGWPPTGLTERELPDGVNEDCPKQREQCVG
jgi:hypothetical protein